MDFIMDVLVEGFFELFGEGFLSLCSAFIPDKILSEKSQRIIGIIFFIIALALFVGLIIGVVLLVETGGQSLWGWLLVSVSAIYMVSGIVLKIRSHIKK